jgi:YidC/Oxa1 family membrane protein insertase
MEKNAILAFVLSMAVFAAYFLIFSPPQPPKTVQEKPAASPKEGSPAPKEAVQAQPPAVSAAQTTAVEKQDALQGPVKEVKVQTKRFTAVFTEQGGVLKSQKLTSYRETLGGKEPKEIIHVSSPQQYPLHTEWVKNSLPPSSALRFTADKDTVTLTPDHPQDALSFQWSSGQGLTLVKTYRFHYDSYRIDLEVTLQNRSDRPLDDNLVLNLENGFPKSSDNSTAFRGFLRLIDGRYKETAVGKVEKEEVFTGKIRWGALADTYFMEAAVPLEENPLASLKIVKPASDQLKMSLISAPLQVGPQGEKRLRYALYLGPRDTRILKPLGLDLEKAVNFGFFDIIAKPLLWVLRFFNGFLHNYGWSIILLTVLVKILFWPLTHKSYKSMKDMQKLAPKVAKLREKYKDDRQKLNQEIMALYKTYKVNPMGGCLPMLIQIPVFFALYSLLGYAIELRHAPFLLWINDLSAPDRLPIGVQIPYVGNGIPVLTLLMGASMFVQQKMTPTTGDPTQAKLMLFLPVIFTFMFINFASGLVLYWLVNNLLSIGQQYYINKYVP